MRVAIVHELLTTKGGAERVARIFADMFPDAPVYTLLYDKQKMHDWFPAERVRTSRVQKQFSWLPKGIRYNHRYLFPFFPRAVQEWNFSEYDLVISSSSAYVHGILTNGKPKHISYIHSPARYLWDRTHDALEQQSKGIFGALRRRILHELFHRSRMWDAEASYRADTLLAASQQIKRRIELYWRQESDVLYPPIEDHWFDAKEEPTEEFYLIVSTLAAYKRIELAIDACKAAGVKLKIAGDGPIRKELEKRSDEHIEFLGHQSDAELASLYSKAKAIIFPGEEDFGLVPVEAMACGTPVIAYNGGGARETVVEGTTGTFFSEKNAESLAQILRNFDHKKYTKSNCRSHAQKWNRSNFEQQLHTKISALMNKK